MIGVVQARAILADMLAGKSLDIRANVRHAPVVPDTLDALDVLQVLREAEVPLALVHDEYGHFEGVVTPADLLEAIAGVFRSDAGEPEPDAVRREDGSWLLAGSMPADEMAEQLGVPLPASASIIRSPASSSASCNISQRPASAWRRSAGASRWLTSTAAASTRCWRRRSRRRRFEV